MTFVHFARPIGFYHENGSFTTVSTEIAWQNERGLESDFYRSFAGPRFLLFSRAGTIIIFNEAM